MSLRRAKVFHRRELKIEVRQVQEQQPPFELVPIMCYLGLLERTSKKHRAGAKPATAYHLALS